MFISYVNSYTRGVTEPLKAQDRRWSDSFSGFNLGELVSVRGLSELADLVFDPTVVGSTDHGHRYTNNKAKYREERGRSTRVS